MNKTIIIAIALIVVVAVGVGVFWFAHNNAAPAGNGEVGQLPSVGLGTSGNTGPLNPPTGNYATSTSFPTSTTITIGTNQGPVTMNNFYKNPSLVTPDGGTVLIVGTTSYQLAYSVSDSSFSIALTSAPLADARAAAEAALIQSLGITQQQACMLTVYESVPVSVDPAYAGDNLGLSFCPGAVRL